MSLVSCSQWQFNHYTADLLSSQTADTSELKLIRAGISSQHGAQLLGDVGSDLESAYSGSYIRHSLLPMWPSSFPALQLADTLFAPLALHFVPFSAACW